MTTQIRFPPVEMADADGLLMLGGSLTTGWLLAAYRRGIFPWPFDDDDTAPVAWWSPDPRAVFEPERFRISRRLRSTLRSGKFQITVNADFAGVVAGCAAPRRNSEGTWITKSLAQGFLRLHELGYAHSVEAWFAGRLVGGVYGVAMGAYFSAESMFHRTTDASKVALAHLMQRLGERGYTLVDIQQRTSHTTGLGATEIRRHVFLQRLKHALAQDVTFVDAPPAAHV